MIFRKRSSSQEKSPCAEALIISPDLTAFGKRDACYDHERGRAYTPFFHVLKDIMEESVLLNINVDWLPHDEYISHHPTH